MGAFVKTRLKQQKELDLVTAVAELEHAYAEEAMRRHGNIMRAAEALGISRAKLYRILEHDGVKRESLRGSARPAKTRGPGRPAAGKKKTRKKRGGSKKKRR